MNTRISPIVRLRSAALVVALAAGIASAAGGPENALLIIDPSNPLSLYLGNYYKNARNLPDSAVLYLDPSAPDHAAFAATNLPALFGALHNAGTANHTDFIIIAPDDQFFMARSGEITDDCAPVNRISLSGAYTAAFIADEMLGGTKSTLANGFFSGVQTPVAFDSDIAYYQGKGSNDPKARRYYIGALLGYTGHNGNSLEDLIAMIDRAVAADGSRPAGTFYFMNNAADPARNVRAGTYASIANALVALGFSAEKLDGILPLGRTDAVGIMTGAANPNIFTNQYSFAPGSAPFADHLTSYAGTFDNDSQTKMSEWIVKGAIGSLGAVEEPCNYNGKFPAARTHLYLAQGASLAESYYRGAQYVPFQMLFYGDPLARPYAFIPVVSVPDAPQGPVSGTIQFSPAATTDRPGANIIALDTLIDGVKGNLIIPGQKATIDTTLLSDGYHDLRVLAYDTSALLTQGRWTGPLIVNNHGLSVSVIPNQSSGNLGGLFALDVTASGGPVKEVRILHNGRVVAAADGPGIINIRGQTLGAGRIALHAQAVFQNGLSALSAPVPLEINFIGGGPGPEPIAFSYTKAVPSLGAALLVELPATFTDSPADATTTVLSAPAQATVLLNDGSPYILIQPNEDAVGKDTISFLITTPSGTSNTATVTLDYGDAPPPCAPDLNADGTLDLFDFLAFTNLFNAKDPAADCTGDGTFDLFDFLCFVNAFNAGC